MSPVGRPKSNNPKSNPIHVRLDNDSLTILNAYCNMRCISRTEGIREAIKLLKVK